MNEEMRKAGFTFDPSGSGLERWINYALNIVCLRQPYMTDAQWKAEQERKIADVKLVSLLRDSSSV